MRRLQAWWDGIALSSQYSPPQVVEVVMLLLAMLICLVWWIQQDWQYLALCLSYMVGAIASILARETVAPSTQAHTIRFTAVLSLVALLSMFGLYVAPLLS
ncbi:MAG: hypothetical protein HC866_22025 [Leptolyngbyaceae cyanobacterium RU_5_1]|nr:hypothetical protein [Leptolyngbyaceae cyanobacterium RU_5_1]